jgi:hypothetical protein
MAANIFKTAAIILDYDYHCSGMLNCKRAWWLEKRGWKQKIYRKANASI